MNVLFLTVFLSLVLAVFFVAGFLYHCLRGSGDPRRDSLLPFGKEQSPPKPRPPAAPKHP